jgi:large subunit ribosomal protein L6
MSRIGKNPVAIPSGVNVAVAGQVVNIQGKLGKHALDIPPDVMVAVAEGKVTLTPREQSKRARSLWGTSRALIATGIRGVSQGFTRNLEINGVGYRAQLEGKNLNLQLGFSHDIKYPIPEGITIKVGEKQTTITITGADKQKVGQVAAEIRGLRKPEPYKGKGIKYDVEHIRRKEGKKK